MPVDRFSYTENLLNLAAVIYRPGDDVDGLLVSLASRLQTEGYRLGGVVQRNQRGACGPIKLMEVVDLMTARAISICQNLGPGSAGCKLNQSGLADAAQAEGCARKSPMPSWLASPSSLLSQSGFIRHGRNSPAVLAQPCCAMKMSPPHGGTTPRAGPPGGAVLISFPPEHG